MFLKKVEITKYKVFDNIEIEFEKNNTSPIYSIASINGAGKSTLLQFIFTLLHCFMVSKKRVYIKNLLEDTEITNSENTKLAKFIIEEDNKDYELEFIISPAVTKERNFNLRSDLEKKEKEIQQSKKENNLYEKILKIKNKLEGIDSLAPISTEDSENIKKFITNSTAERLFKQATTSKKIEDYKQLIEYIIELNNISPINIPLLELDYKLIQEEIKKTQNSLEKDNLTPIIDINNEENVLLLKTSMPDNLLKKLSDKIFLAAPSTQIFLFLSKKDKHFVYINALLRKYYENKEQESESFSDDSFAYKYDEDESFLDDSYGYEDALYYASINMGNFYTYEFVPNKLIIDAFKKALGEDINVKLETNKYGTNYDNLVNSLKNFFEDKTISVDKNLERIFFKLKKNGKELEPENLSHGELRKLSIFIWIKYLIDKDSIVLMDEVDMALHPKWQYEMVENLSSWSNASQFILATHSPQIIGSTYYKNIIKLEKDKSKIKIEYLNKPPLDRDINTIISTIMNAPDFPIELLKRHKEYRKLINEGKVNSKEAKELKDKILEYESENSSFFQDINFDLELDK